MTGHLLADDDSSYGPPTLAGALGARGHRLVLGQVFLVFCFLRHRHGVLFIEATLEIMARGNRGRTYMS
jgi:hypothetical protein